MDSVIARPHPLSRQLAALIFAPINHNHNDLYYTEGEVDSALATLAGEVSTALSALSSVYQPLDADLTAIASLGTTGFARRTGTNTWSASTIASADLTSALTTPPAIGGTTQAAISGTTGLFTAGNTTAGTFLFTPSLAVRGASAGAVVIGVSAAEDNANAVVFEMNNTSNGKRWSFTMKSSLNPVYTANALVFNHYNGTSYPNEAVVLTPTGQLGIGTAYRPATRLHILESTANTVTPANVVTIGANSTGTAGAGFGAGLLWTLESSTTNDRGAAIDEAVWNTATDAGAIGDRIVSAYYNAGGTTTKREGFRVRGGASATAIGFFGATPVAKPALGTWAGLTTDQKLDALRDALSNLGLASYS